MRPLLSNEISGTWATLLLPINQDESIDFIRLGDEIDVLLASGVDGIYSNGTAGEFQAQDEAEFDRVQALLADKCEEKGLPFQIGASHMSAQVSLSRIRRAAKLKPGAVQVILPDWVQVTVEEAIAFLQKAAEAADPVGLVLYNPPHAKRLLQPDEYGRISAAVPSLRGIKVAGEMEWYASIRKQAPALSLFVAGHHLASGYKTGAAGSYSNVACLHPKGAKRWYDQMKTDLPGAIELETRILGFLSNHILPLYFEDHYSAPALDKFLAAIGGWANVGTRIRWPYRWLNESDAIALRPIARNRLPELFAP